MLGFERQEDAKRVLAVLGKRFERYSLKLHPEKTRLVDFRSPRVGVTESAQSARSFDMLGFTHFWARSRKGRWVVTRKTAKARFGRAVRRIAQWCRRFRHLSVREQQQALNRKLQGHYAYYGVTGNARALARFLHEVGRTWRKWLGRRSQRACMTWARFNRLLQHYPLVPVCVVHSVYRCAANP